MSEKFYLINFVNFFEMNQEPTEFTFSTDFSILKTSFAIKIST